MLLLIEASNKWLGLRGWGRTPANDVNAYMPRQSDKHVQHARAPSPSANPSRAGGRGVTNTYRLRHQVAVPDIGKQAQTFKWLWFEAPLHSLLNAASLPGFRRRCCEHTAPFVCTLERGRGSRKLGSSM